MTPTSTRLLEAVDHLGYDAYDAPRYVEADSWQHVLEAIEREAGGSELLVAATDLRDIIGRLPRDVVLPTELFEAARRLSGVLREGDRPVMLLPASDRSTTDAEAPGDSNAEIATREALRSIFAAPYSFGSGGATSIIYGDAPTRLILALREQGYDVAPSDMLMRLTEAEAVLLLRYRQTGPDVCLRCSKANHEGRCVEADV